MKKNVLKKMVAILVMGLGVVSMTACGGASKAQTDKEEGSSESVKTEEKTTVKIADFKIYPASCQIIIADKKGFFKQEFDKVGADYSITKFLNGPAINEAFASKDVDFSAIGALPGYTGINNTKNQIFIGNDLTNFGEAVITYDGSGIESVGDLKGKKVGFAVGTADQTILEEILLDYSLSINDITPVNVAEEAKRENSIISKNVDAILIYEPYLTSILSTESDLKVIETNEKHGSVVPLVARADFVEEHPDIAEAFVRAIQDANDWLLANKDETIKIVSEETGVDETSIKATIEKNKYATAFTDEDITELHSVVDYLKKEGNIDNDFDADKYINKTFYEKINSK